MVKSRSYPVRGTKQYQRMNRPEMTDPVSAISGLWAIIVTRRNIMLAQIEMGFIEAVSARLARRLGAAPWPVVSRLQHARATHLMSGDIHRVGTATHYMVQFAGTMVIIGAQIIMPLLRAP